MRTLFLYFAKTCHKKLFYNYSVCVGVIINTLLSLLVVTPTMKKHVAQRPPNGLGMSSCLLTQSNCYVAKHDYEKRENTIKRQRNNM